MKCLGIVFSTLILLILHYISAEDPIEKYNACKLDADQNIVGGVETLLGQWPHMVAIIATSKTKEGLCGGSLISHRYILTAASCIDL